jgi:tetratricopeptide (TPR) repeat protein
MTFALLLFLAQDPEALSARALEMAQQRRFVEAEKLWRQALDADPRLFSAAFNLGFFYYSQQQHEKARPYLERAVASQPKDFNARYVLGATLAQLGRGDDALRKWREALAIRPDHLKLLQLMAIEYGKGRYFREAAAAAERALALNSDDQNLYLIAIKSHQDAADHAAALKIAGRMVGKFPESARANFEYGFELHRAGRLAESLPYLEKAMRAAETYEEPFFFYGEVLLKEGRAGEAIPYLRRAIERRRDYMAALVALGRALMRLARYDEARTELLRAIEIDPTHPQPRLLLAQLYFRLGEEELATREKEISLELRRKHPEAMESPQSRPFR